MSDEKQETEVRIQESEEKKIHKSGSAAFYSEFWILTPEFCFSSLLFHRVASLLPSVEASVKRMHALPTAIH
jgi:hypothetical protein